MDSIAESRSERIGKIQHPPDPRTSEIDGLAFICGCLRSLRFLRQKPSPSRYRHIFWRGAVDRRLGVSRRSRQTGRIERKKRKERKQPQMNQTGQGALTTRVISSRGRPKCSNRHGRGPVALG